VLQLKFSEGELMEVVLKRLGRLRRQRLPRKTCGPRSEAACLRHGENSAACATTTYGCVCRLVFREALLLHEFCSRLDY